MGTMGMMAVGFSAVVIGAFLWWQAWRMGRIGRRGQMGEVERIEEEGGRLKVRPLEEGELREVGLLDQDGPLFLAPLHVAEGMRAAMALEIGRTRPGVQGYTDGLARAAGYLAACAEFERLWTELGEKGRAGRRRPEEGDRTEEDGGERG